MIKKSPDPIDKHVGSMVRIRRKTLGMSQQKLGDAIGITFQQIQKYENGTNRIGSSRLQQIAHILHVPPASFFDGAPTASTSCSTENADPSVASLIGFLSTRDGLALAKGFMRIDVKLRRRIVDLVWTITDAGR